MSRFCILSANDRTIKVKAAEIYQYFVLKVKFLEQTFSPSLKNCPLQTYYDCLEYNYCPVNQTTGKTKNKKCPAGREYFCNRELYGDCQTSLEDTCKYCDAGFYRDEDMAKDAGSPCLVRV